MKAGYGIIASDGNIIMKHREYGDFWIIHQCIDFELEEQNAIYESYRNIFVDYKDADKNTSLLIIINVELADDTLKKRIIDIENDPFLFKKYVLVYNENDWEELLKVIAGKEVSKLIMEREAFRKLKEEDLQDGIGCYHLLYSIAHKLPFMMANVQPIASAGLVNTYQAKDDNDKKAYEWFMNIEAPKDAEKLEELITSEISDEK